jgi:predicted RNase H-like HicB family nuclease
MNYLVIIEQAADGSHSAYVPDLPGCTSCGDTLEEAERMIREAMPLHLESLRAHGDPIPEPTSKVLTVHTG